MSETNEVAAFLAARLDEDEQWAKDLIACDRGDVSGMLGISQRMLREVAAHRAILADCVRAIGPDRERRWSGLRSPYDAPHANLAFRTLLSLASAYGTHPDYRETWKP